MSQSGRGIAVIQHTYCTRVLRGQSAFSLLRTRRGCAAEQRGGERYRRLRRTLLLTHHTSVIVSGVVAVTQYVCPAFLRPQQLYTVFAIVTSYINLSPFQKAPVTARDGALYRYSRGGGGGGGSLYSYCTMRRSASPIPQVFAPGSASSRTPDLINGHSFLHTQPLCRSKDRYIQGISPHSPLRSGSLLSIAFPLPIPLPLPLPLPLHLPCACARTVFPNPASHP